MSIRSEIKNNNLQAINQPYTKSIRNPGRKSTLKKKSVKIRVPFKRGRAGDPSPHHEVRHRTRNQLHPQKNPCPIPLRCLGALSVFAVLFPFEHFDRGSSVGVAGIEQLVVGGWGSVVAAPQQQQLVEDRIAAEGGRRGREQIAQVGELLGG